LASKPKPGRAIKPVVLVEDNGPIHVSKLTRAALDARTHWLRVEWLPKYAPELNDIEVVWHDLKAHHLAHRTFTDASALNQSIRAAVDDMNSERSVQPLVNIRICLGITWRPISEAPRCITPRYDDNGNDVGGSNPDAQMHR